MLEPVKNLLRWCFVSQATVLVLSNTDTRSRVPSEFGWNRLRLSVNDRKKLSSGLFLTSKLRIPVKQYALNWQFQEQTVTQDI